MNDLKKIYLGLPFEFKDKVLWIADNYRTNPLSHQPGGNDIVIEYTNGKIYAYDRIKSPSPYINKIVINHFTKKSLSLDNISRVLQIKVVKSEVKRLFARKYTMKMNINRIHLRKCGIITTQSIYLGKAWLVLKNKIIVPFLMKYYNNSSSKPPCC